MSQAEISKYETGIKVPGEQQVRRFASHLHFPMEFFYLSESKRILALDASTTIARGKVREKENCANSLLL